MDSPIYTKYRNIIQKLRGLPEKNKLLILSLVVGLCSGLAAVILGWKMGLACCGLYLLIGSVGVPVFSDYTGGLARFTGVTGGYLIGFLFFTLVGGICAGAAFSAFRNRQVYCIAATAAGLILGDAVLYLFGTAWFVLSAHTTVSYAVSVCVVPFLLPDLIKLVLASLLGVQIRQTLQKAGILKRA